jgi:cell filamentation protein, protein adenylyltransferase
MLLGATGTAERLGVSEPSVYSALSRLEEAGVLREVTGRRRGRLYVYERYLELLQAED